MTIDLDRFVHLMFGTVWCILRSYLSFCIAPTDPLSQTVSFTGGCHASNRLGGSMFWIEYTGAWNCIVRTTFDIYPPIVLTEFIQGLRAAPLQDEQTLELRPGASRSVTEVNEMGSSRSRWLSSKTTFQLQIECIWSHWARRPNWHWLIVNHVMRMVTSSSLVTLNSTSS